MNSFKIVQQEVDELVDGLGFPIDDGIKKIVAALRLIGLQTSASCEGHMDWGLPYPWVQTHDGNENNAIRARAEYAALKALLDEFYEGREFTPITLSYFYPDGIIRLMPYKSVNEDGTRDQFLLSFYQKKIDEFADWLMRKYENSRSSSRRLD